MKSSSLYSVIDNVNKVALGETASDLVLRGCTLVNVYSREILEKTDIAVSGDRIAYVGPDASHTIDDKKTTVLDLNGKYVTPGFADPHTHIDHFVHPSELVSQVLLCGTTCLFPDPIDIVSVCGYKGFREFVKTLNDLPIRAFTVVPGGVPVDKKFSHSKFLSRTDLKQARKLDNVIGMGEVFSWTKVTMRDPDTMAAIRHMLTHNCIINGHTAGASEKKLMSYVASGILSCHEPIDYNEVIQRLRIGMSIMMREGSIRRDLENMIPSIISHKNYFDKLMFCTDGVNPQDLKTYGHINHCVKKAISLGLDKIDAITMASRNCFDYYGMGHDLGGIAPGKLADLLIFKDLEEIGEGNNSSGSNAIENVSYNAIRPEQVYIGGNQVVNNYKLQVKTKKPSIPKPMKDTVRTTKFSEKNFFVKPPKNNKNSHCNALVVNMVSEIITKKDFEDLEVRKGNVVSSAEKDVSKVAAIDRSGKSKNVRYFVGFLKGFGARVGAFACTSSFHENDLIIIGHSEKDMAIAANKIRQMQGGMVVVDQGKTIARFDMPYAGLLSVKPFDTASSEFSSLIKSLVDRGSNFKAPHLVPIFLPFLALPSLRILYSGIVDIKKREHLDMFSEKQ